MKTLLSLLAITVALTLNTRAADAPINTECPVCHKDARLIFRSKRPQAEILDELSARADLAPDAEHWEARKKINHHFSAPSLAALMASLSADVDP